MVKKVRTPGAAKVKTSSQATRNTRPITNVNKAPNPKPVEKGPDEVDIDDIILL